jgi:hypothetical protein
MKTLLKTDSTSLHLLVNHLIAGSLPTAVHNNSIIVNDVPAEFCIEADGYMVASVISALLNTVTGCAKNSCISISAKNYGNVILVHIRNSNSTKRIDVADSLQQVKSLVEKTTGYVSVTSEIKKVMTIAYSFSNLPIAA